MQARTLDLTPYLALVSSELPRGVMVEKISPALGRVVEYDKKARRPLADLCRHLLKAKGVRSVRMQCPDPSLCCTVSIFPAEGWPVYSFPAQDFLACEALILKEKKKPASST
jgi:hypothetical protein